MSRTTLQTRVLPAVAGVLAFGLAGGAFAQTVTDDFTVTLTITEECKIAAADNIAFTDGVLDATIDFTGDIDVQCTSGTGYTIELDAGAGAGATTSVRRMTFNAATVNYALYRNALRTQVWGTAGDAAAGTGNGAVQAVTVYGRLLAQTTPAPGAYVDTVNVTVTY